MVKRCRTLGLLLLTPITGAAPAARYSRPEMSSRLEGLVADHRPGVLGEPLDWYRRFGDARFGEQFACGLAGVMATAACRAAGLAVG